MKSFCRFAVKEVTTMDPNLTCIDPNLLQLSQLLEEDEEVPPPPIETPPTATATGAAEKSVIEGKERIDDTAFSETVAAFSEAKKRLSEDDVLSANPEVSGKKQRVHVDVVKDEDLRELLINREALSRLKLSLLLMLFMQGV